MKIFKRRRVGFISLIMAILLSLFLTACGDDGGGKTGDTLAPVQVQAPPLQVASQPIYTQAQQAQSIQPVQQPLYQPQQAPIIVQSPPQESIGLNGLVTGALIAHAFSGVGNQGNRTIINKTIVQKNYSRPSFSSKTSPGFRRR